MKALITGATKGIGRAIALKLAENGYSIAICARTFSDLEAFKKDLEIFGNDVLIFQADCKKKSEVNKFCEHVVNIWGEIDVLVNNVGVFIPGNLLDEEDDAFESQVAINLNAPYYFSKFFGKLMKHNRRGHIFNIVSVSAMPNSVGYGSYGVTKSALLSLNNVTRQELAPFGVKVTAIIPGETLTNSWEGTTMPADLFVHPEEIASMLYNTLQLGHNTQVDEIIIRPTLFKY